MRIFVIYTAARALLFAVVFGLLWLVFARWLDWNSITALWTALIALVISSVLALIALRSLRDDLAVEVAARAERAKASYEARRKAED